MLIDDVTIRIKAGDGGHGAVAFQKIMKSLGPTGTRGGNGGSVYAEGVSDLTALRQFRYKKDIAAEDGRPGRGQFRDGSAGKDVVLKVPVGTAIHNLETRKTDEIVHVGEKILIAKGGLGGRGNFHFRGPKNTTPKEAEPGSPGEKFDIRFELKLIADVGLIGLPNAGKSSLLNELTNASAKVANYPFTTLEPNLGVYYDLVLADIPGLIEGASRGKGLGMKFLRHIERTKELFHLVSAESADPVGDYEIVRKELGLYSKKLIGKPEFVLVSKSDLVPKERLVSILKKFRRKNIRVGAVSIHDAESLEELKRVLSAIAQVK